MIVRKDAAAVIPFEGLVVHDFTQGQNTSSSFAIIDVPPGALHRRAFSKRSDKYYYVVSGQIAFTIDDVEHVVNAGDFCLIAQGRRFSYRNLTALPAVLALVHTPRFDLQFEVFV